MKFIIEGEVEETVTFKLREAADGDMHIYANNVLVAFFEVNDRIFKRVSDVGERECGLPCDDQGRIKVKNYD